MSQITIDSLEESRFDSSYNICQLIGGSNIQLTETTGWRTASMRLGWVRNPAPVS